MEDVGSVFTYGFYTFNEQFISFNNFPPTFDIGIFKAVLFHVLDSFEVVDLVKLIIIFAEANFGILVVQNRAGKVFAVFDWLELLGHHFFLYHFCYLILSYTVSKIQSFFFTLKCRVILMVFGLEVGRVYGGNLFS